MTLAEFTAWQVFFVKYPFDDYHRFHRPAALVAQLAGGGSLLDKLEWLQPEHADQEVTDADAATMRAFGYTRKGG